MDDPFPALLSIVAGVLLIFTALFAPALAAGLSVLLVGGLTVHQARRRTSS